MITKVPGAEAGTEYMHHTQLSSGQPIGSPQALMAPSRSVSVFFFSGLVLSSVFSFLPGLLARRTRATECEKNVTWPETWTPAVESHPARW